MLSVNWSSQTVLKLTSWLFGTDLSTLGRKRARAHQISGPNSTHEIIFKKYIIEERGFDERNIKIAPPLFRSKVDRFVPQTQNVNLGIGSELK